MGVGVGSTSTRGALQAAPVLTYVDAMGNLALRARNHGPFLVLSLRQDKSPSIRVFGGSERGRATHPTAWVGDSSTKRYKPHESGTTTK
jgi:hypothetical protein